MTNGERAIMEWIKRKELALAKCRDRFLQANLRQQIRDLEEQLRNERAKAQPSGARNSTEWGWVDA